MTGKKPNLFFKSYLGVMLKEFSFTKSVMSDCLVQDIREKSTTNIHRTSQTFTQMRDGFVSHLVCT